MIVKCERCQTRFKIPDEKVTEKGVKVRCTKCQNTFRVTREAAAGPPGEPPAPSSGGQVDPFAQFGVAPDPTTVDVTKPGYFELGVEASRPMPARPTPPASNWNSMDGDLGSEDGVFREPTRITSLPLPPAARPPEAPVGRAPPPGAFVVPGPERSGRPPAAVPASPGPGSAPARAAGARGAGTPAGVEDRSVPPVPEPAAGAPVSPASARRTAAPPVADPFSELLGPSSPAAPSASAKALGRSAVTPPPVGAPVAAMALGTVRPGGAPPAYGGDDPFASIDIDDAAAMPSTTTGAPPPVENDPFASIDIDDATVPSAAPGLPRPVGSDPFASIDIHAPVPAKATPPTVGKGPLAAVDLHASGPAKPSKAASPSVGSGPLVAVDLHASSPAAVGGNDPFAAIDLRAPAASARKAAPAPVGSDPFASVDLHADAPAAIPPTANPRDLFDLGSDVGGHGEDSGLLPTDTGRAALFGTSDAADASLLGEVPPAADDAEAFGVTLGRVGASSGVQREVLDMDGLPAKPVVTVAKPTARPEDVGIPLSRPSSRLRKALGATVNFVLAAALVAVLGTVGRGYLREGRLDVSALSLDALRALFVPAPKPLVAVDVTNGLYETREGPSLFYVRGDAVNHSDTAARIRVRAALYDGSQRVASSEALVGGVPTPEELYGVGSLDAAVALRQRVDEAAVSVAPGAKAPFVVIFPEHPSDPGGYRLEVTLEPERSKTAEAGPRTE
ncbi:zinc-ribbon domain-containing protein [Myxococcus sp. AM009]|uniref:zinc-ribbon domain-containing protein n=1 Tax=Myxococcus sp. AM009 TaxID=2745137 RepID=UPI0017F9E1DB|nr:zinc-ribbon domain-containing protein [Myxococcus sp. AM009]NVJ02379.1 zinc-ribbon domain-containing protein [Myxococcus sp. AM009]